MQLSDIESSILLFQHQLVFDIRSAWRRLTAAIPAAADMTLDEFTVAFNAFQEECATDGNLSELHWYGCDSNHFRKCLQDVRVPTLQLNNAEVEEAMRFALERRKLLVWPGPKEFWRHLLQKERMRRAYSACAREAAAGRPQPTAPACVKPSETVTPSQLRRAPDDEKKKEATKGTTSKKAWRWKLRKEQIASGNKKAAMLPPGERRDRLRVAVERFERNNAAVEQARLARHVYRPHEDTPVGWINVSGNSKVLDQFGLKPEHLVVQEKTLAQVYQPDPKVFGDDMKPQIVFQGTRDGSSEDWKHNRRQAINWHSDYYERAALIAKLVRRHNTSVDFAGHSLGGGLASAASQASGRSGSTFNAAGLHPSTVERYSGAPPLSSHIDAFHVKGDVLTNIQATQLAVEIEGQSNRKVANIFPTALGVRHELPGHGSGLDRHGIDMAIAGLEIQKEEDKASITRELNQSDEVPPQPTHDTLRA